MRTHTAADKDMDMAQPSNRTRVAPCSESEYCHKTLLGNCATVQLRFHGRFRLTLYIWYSVVSTFSSMLRRVRQALTITSVLFTCILLGPFWGTLSSALKQFVARDQRLEAAEKQTTLSFFQANQLETKEMLPTKFLYLLQTESCLPNHLKSADSLGIESACQCDVLVLSFRKNCNVTAPTHINYIFNSSTTWAMGRNLLYEVARRRSEKYLYYIFMDDDIHLRNHSPKTKRNPWRWFEDFLKRIEPAVGVADGSGHPYLPVVYKARRDRSCKLENRTEYVPSPRFDAAFNAFHYKAVDYILPYTLKFDTISWWYPVVYAEIKTEVTFQGHVVIHTGVLAVNPKHRPYKRKEPDDRGILEITDEIRAGLHRMYQNANVLLEWRKDGVKHEHMSSTICLPPPPPHMPIKPFHSL